jgi:hypothetical protein
VGTDHIDFISAYCDRWCERCAYTSRCSAFAINAAIAMIGDVKEGIQLAIGSPLPVESEGAQAVLPDWVKDLENVEMTAEERAEFDRREAARDSRVDRMTITQIARALTMLSHRWFRQNEHRLSSADEVVGEAIEVALHDEAFVSAKLHRALHGRDAYEHDGDGDDHPIQNDWNGSAKVALISLERSEAAWRVIAESTGDEIPLTIAGQLQDLRREVNQQFPQAWSFIRPGFDEPGR